MGVCLDLSGTIKKASSYFMIYLGADHRGFYLKERLKEYLQAIHQDFEDLGNFVYDVQDDYPDFARLVAQKISRRPKNNFGILICGSGQGMNIVANKYPKIRSALCLSRWMAQQARRDDDANILVLAADFTDTQTAFSIIKTFLNTKASQQMRFKRRLKKIALLEKKLFKY
ncbi:MAG: ribose 5-phosphate isomerase [Patescibacteria group bacterium]|nr:ribose 5-phosphate isomerase [Patescibacteria group bacterium]